MKDLRNDVRSLMSKYFKKLRVVLGERRVGCLRKIDCSSFHLFMVGTVFMRKRGRFFSACLDLFEFSYFLCSVFLRKTCCVQFRTTSISPLGFSLSLYLSLPVSV